MTSNEGIINSLSYSNDGKTISSGNNGSSVELWNATTYKIIGNLTGKFYFNLNKFYLIDILKIYRTLTS